MSKKVRFTISLDPAVHRALTRVAAANNRPLVREAASMITQKVADMVALKVKETAK